MVSVPCSSVMPSLSGVAAECVLPFLDLQEFCTFAQTERQSRAVACGEVGASILHGQLGSALSGSVAELGACAAALKKLQCHFAQNCCWRGMARDLALVKLRRLRESFPESLILLQELRLAADFAAHLTEPLAFAQTEPPLVVSLGSAKVSLTLRLQCVAAQFFRKAEPLANLLLSINLQVIDGTLFTSGNSVCGSGHRLSCICAGADDSADHPKIFCSFKEAYLRPCWRDPRLLVSAERRNLQSVQLIDGRRLDGPALVWRLAFLFYRSDDDEGPDEEADVFS
eukprot:TRINITY_DN94327_c0_g1_i1.p1 TRINITY_DN94327_c0_g1~~TRINITY_DN94327_c0_g1_i1.p1  ORF type:complete len:284 (-),score=42.88 TRINITY_DN94327_c0_g1_i1:139-990(-)